MVGVTGRPWAEIEGESMCHAILRFESGKTASYQVRVLWLCAVTVWLCAVCCDRVLWLCCVLWLCTTI